MNKSEKIKWAYKFIDCCADRVDVSHFHSLISEYASLIDPQQMYERAFIRSAYRGHYGFCDFLHGEMHRKRLKLSDETIRDTCKCVRDHASPEDARSFDAWVSIWNS